MFALFGVQCPPNEGGMGVGFADLVLTDRYCHDVSVLNTLAMSDPRYQIHGNLISCGAARSPLNPHHPVSVSVRTLEIFPTI